MDNYKNRSAYYFSLEVSNRRLRANSSGRDLKTTTGSDLLVSLSEKLRQWRKKPGE